MVSLLEEILPNPSFDPTGQVEILCTPQLPTYSPYGARMISLSYFLTHSPGVYHS